MIHNYFDVDIDLLWTTVKDDLPKLKQQTDRLLMRGIERRFRLPRSPFGREFSNRQQFRNTPALQSENTTEFQSQSEASRNIKGDRPEQARSWSCTIFSPRSTRS
jgi:hypothetical protein